MSIKCSALKVFATGKRRKCDEQGVLSLDFTPLLLAINGYAYRSYAVSTDDP